MLRTKELLETDIFVCKTIRKNGISQFRQIVIGDNTTIIVRHVNKYMKRCKKLLRNI